MRLRHIEVFQAVLQAGTLTGAARLLNVSQPAVTKLLQHAELQLGFALFTRVLGRLQLTPEGHLLKDRIERVSDDLRELQRLAENIRQPDHHPLRVVSTPTLASALVPRAVTRLRKDFPEAAVELFTQHSQEMLNSVLLRETDIGLTLQDVFHPGIHPEMLCQGRLMVIAPEGWWKQAELSRPVPLDSLAGVPMVGIAVKDQLGRMLRAHMQYLSPPPRIHTHVQTYQFARALVADGHGLALVDPFTALVQDDDEVQVRVLEPAVPVPLYALYRKGSRLSAIQKGFLAQAKKLSRSYVGA